jgi:vanillate O-demethylase ferredoxin subunit
MRTAETWSDARVRSIAELTPTIRLFEIEPANEAPTSYPLGGHLNIGVLIDGKADTRSYSIVGADGCYRIAVKLDREGRGGSAYMWSLKPGARLTVSNAKTNFALDFGRSDYLLVAGGIGITPIFGMARALAQHGARVRMAYAVRAAEELAFVKELRAALGDRLTTYVSSQGQRLDLQAVLSSAAAGGLAMVCGPLPMLDQAKRVWKNLGRAVADLRFETFGSSGAHAAEPFRVRVPQLDRDILVPENKSMLDALADAGVEVMFDCKRGECGVCAVNIIGVDGTVDHRDVFFSEQQKQRNYKICACVSRSIGTLTIDALIRPDRPR